jgi:hypothetical protein
MAKKSDKARGICYKPFPHINRSSLHSYVNPSTIHDSTQAVWTIQCVLYLISFAVPHLASAGDGHKLTPANQGVVAKQLNQKIVVGGRKKLSSVQTKLSDVCGHYPSSICSVSSDLVLVAFCLSDCRFFGE